MPEHAARVAHFLGEPLAGRETIARMRKHQWMAAPYADVLVHIVAIGETDVRVMSQKARQRVAHVRGCAVFAKVLGAASAPPCGSVGSPE